MCLSQPEFAKFSDQGGDGIDQKAFHRKLTATGGSGMRNRRVKGWILVLFLATVVVILGSCATSSRAPDDTVRTQETWINTPLPPFPWPPPPASAETMIPHNWLPTRGAAQLADIADRLTLVLNTAKYPRWSYSSAPNGFALVCHMEQIKSDGTPSPEPARWSTDLPWVANMTLLEFIEAMVHAEPGYYRVIVFIVTNQPWSRTGETLTGEIAEQWLAEGFNWLPDSIGKLIYGHDYRTTALVYEFKKVSQDANLTFLKFSLISADDHLKKAGIYDPLSRR